jgi:imidazole glycerol-phosphate synthase subunit HisH
MIAIVDYDIGNLGAVANMLNRIGVRNEITSDPKRIERADRIILPGNGAFDACMRGLRATGLIPLLEEKVLTGRTPLLGICVGAQMLGRGSEEGSEPGLGWIDFEVRRFEEAPGFPVPHMGWNEVEAKHPDHPLTRNMEAGSRFYFVHGYYFSPGPENVLMAARYNIEFCAAVARSNIVGVQFHPEKSHRFGRRLLENFSKAT